MADLPDSAVVLALSRVELSIDHVLDALRTPDPFGIRSALAEYTGQDKPNLAEKALIAAIERLLRMKVPGHTEWPTLPLAERCDWWVDRLGTFAAIIAGLPRVSGAAADRLPIQDSLGATVQAAVIGAICREYGVEDHAERTAVMARILTGREITAETVRRFDDPGAAAADVKTELGLDDGHDRGLRDGIKLVWRIGRMLSKVGEVFEDRPRGSLPARALGKLPGVGMIGGYFDERKGIRKAAYRAGELLSSATI